MTLVAYAFSKLQTVKSMVLKMVKQPRFTAPFYVQDVKGSRTIVKSPSEYFYQIVFLVWGKLTWKSPLLLIFKLLRLFVKTLTADDNYTLWNIWNLQELYQMQLSKKLKRFFLFFAYFWNLHQIFNILKTKMTFIAYVFPK